MMVPIRMLALLPCLGLALGCGDKGSNHWKGDPLETVTGTVSGISFTIDVPKGMRQKA